MRFCNEIEAKMCEKKLVVLWYREQKFLRIDGRVQEEYTKFELEFEFKLNQKNKCEYLDAKP